MAFPPKLALATKNPGKIREILEICADWHVGWITAEGADWPEIEETGETYRENALLKAMEVARVLGVPAVADDSGIEVDALGGGPGPRSARFAGPGATDAENLSLLLARVAGLPDAERAARYRCVAACAWPEGRAIDVEETCEGAITLEPRGSGGFGYDPAFVPVGSSRTMAELPPSEKNRISHRGKALRALGEALREES